MARTKSFPRKHSRPLRTTNTLLGLSYVICLTRKVASTSRAISSAISTLQAHPLKRPLPATVESLLALMSRQVTSLYGLGFSPYLFPRSARDRAHAWAEDFEIELEGHRDRLETLVCEREDAEWVLDLFAEFDRGGEGAQLAVGIGEWRDLVEEVFEDVLEERYDISEDDIAEDAAAVDAQASGTDRTTGVRGVPHRVEDIADDAVDTLHVLAEGYTSWFCGRTTLLFSLPLPPTPMLMDCVHSGAGCDRCVHRPEHGTGLGLVAAGQSAVGDIGTELGRVHADLDARGSRFLSPGAFLFVVRSG